MTLCFYVLGAFLPSIHGSARHAHPLIKTPPGTEDCSTVRTGVRLYVPTADLLTYCIQEGTFWKIFPTRVLVDFHAPSEPLHEAASGHQEATGAVRPAGASLPEALEAHAFEAQKVLFSTFY